MAETTAPAKTQEKTDLAPTREESRYLTPPVDIYETADALVVAADVPGAEKDTVSIRVDNGILTIEAKPSYQPRGTAYSEEFALLNFYRQFQLPDAIDQDKIEAQYKHGVLTVTLPKAEAVKPRQIAVNVK
ncbi:Hsp20/alpha crystallin family protein [Candidatus Sumerlaeota bacterium]|nr:Hsp20/alpha crystallin family protein [Candidatus Sumerlaeota bacterium]